MTAPAQTPDPVSAPAAAARRLVEARYGEGLAAVLGGSAAGGQVHRPQRSGHRRAAARGRV
ncbi:hypothetical protein ACQRET_14970 [Streptomyces koyangensis]|uniref:hypothetical protein n=1 Tax=Streptomyces koyangensis TaxID=188770 RepID=UPI003D011AB8